MGADQLLRNGMSKIKQQLKLEADRPCIGKLTAGYPRAVFVVGNFRVEVSVATEAQDDNGLSFWGREHSRGEVLAWAVRCREVADELYDMATAMVKDGTHCEHCTDAPTCDVCGRGIE